MPSLRGLVFDIKRFAVHDGPGIRSTVFLKGCGLACWWCHNPESINPRPEILVHPERCIGCRACVEACPNGAHRFVESSDGVSDQHEFDRSLCALDGSCVETCYARALELAGKENTVEEVVRVVLEDRDFYKTSGGGVTLSGGEPYLQRQFAAALLSRFKADGLHTAVDTSGHVPWSAIEPTLADVDLFLYDLKHMDSAEHARYTGAGNELILENLKRLSTAGANIEVRVPIIPSINDSETNARALGRFVGRLEGVTRVELLPYHRLAGSKYASVGRANLMPDIQSPGSDDLADLADVMCRACSHDAGRGDLPFKVGDQIKIGSGVKKA